MARLTFYIRTEASNRTGLGHLVRMLAISEKIYSVFRVKPVFLFSGERRILSIIRKKGFTAKCAVSVPGHAGTAIVIIDLPEPQGNKNLKLQNKDFVVTLINKEVDSIDGALVIDVDRQLKERKRQGQIVLSGPRYQILRKEILACRKRYLPGKKLRHVLVTFGGSDPYGVTLKILDMIPMLSKELAFTILLGPAFSHRYCFNAPNVKLVSAPARILEFMTGFDIAICGYGITSYELACLGVPSLIVGQVERQKNAIRRFSRITGSVDLGMHTRLTWQSLKKGIEKLKGVSIRREMWRKSRVAVDGRGSERVVDAINSLVKERK